MDLQREVYVRPPRPIELLAVDSTLLGSILCVILFSFNQRVRMNIATFGVEQLALFSRRNDEAC